MIFKKYFFSISLGIFTLFLSQNSFADVVCRVKVNQVFMAPTFSPSDTTGVIVELVNTTGSTIPGTSWTNNSWRRFYLYGPLGNQSLAILLTAMTTKTKVEAWIKGTALPSSLIFRIGGTQEPQ